MKKRIISLLLAAAMTFSLTACGGNSSDDKKEETKTEITLYENAKLNPVGIPALMQKYRRGLQFKNEQEPKILFTPEGSGNVLTALTDLLTELEQLVEE